jgi:hypothetical protein
MNTDTLTQDRVIMIDYGMSLEGLIAAGKYDWKNDDITAKRFAIQSLGTVQFETRLFHFDCAISSDKVVDSITSNALWEPSKIEHLLAFGATYPEEQRQHRIIGLGSVAKVRGDRRMPYLYRGGAARRGLGLSWWDDVWYGDDRFLAVRKRSSAV